MADESTLDDVVGLISKVADKLEAISGQLDNINTLERVEVLEYRMQVVEKAMIGLGDLHTRLLLIEEAIHRHTACVDKNTVATDKCAETLNGLNK